MVDDHLGDLLGFRGSTGRRRRAVGPARQAGRTSPCRLFNQVLGGRQQPGRASLVRPGAATGPGRPGHHDTPDEALQQVLAKRRQEKTGTSASVWAGLLSPQEGRLTSNSSPAVVAETRTDAVATGAEGLVLTAWVLGIAPAAAAALARFWS